MTVHSRIVMKQKHIEHLYDVFNRSNSAVFRECIYTCIENELKELKRIKQTLRLSK